jgi:hypothetical protein
MTNKIVIISITLAVLLIGAGIILFSLNNYGPKLSQVAYLLVPRITTKPDTKALVVEATGVPGETVGPAFGLLFKTYFKIKGVPKGRSMEAPRARWPKPLTTPRDQWLGIYAIPVPSSVTTLPPIPNKTNLQIVLREWEYGEVAEILHKGPYAAEDTTVQKLRKYIAVQGYEISGDHEEEYLKGPGFLPTDPAKYLTIIRYQVRRVTH